MQAKTQPLPLQVGSTLGTGVHTLSSSLLTISALLYTIMNASLTPVSNSSNTSFLSAGMASVSCLDYLAL